VADFLHRLLALGLGQLLDAPALQQLAVQKVLIERRLLIGEQLVEVLHDLGIAFHRVLR
jgi:hypothetical protein